MKAICEDRDVRIHERLEVAMEDISVMTQRQRDESVCRASCNKSIPVVSEVQISVG